MQAFLLHTHLAITQNRKYIVFLRMQKFASKLMKRTEFTERYKEMSFNFSKIKTFVFGRYNAARTGSLILVDFLIVIVFNCIQIKTKYLTLFC